MDRVHSYRMVGCVHLEALYRRLEDWRFSTVCLEVRYWGFGGWVLWVHLWCCNGGQVTVPSALLLSPMLHPCSALLLLCSIHCSWSALALLHPLLCSEMNCYAHELLVIGLQSTSSHFCVKLLFGTEFSCSPIFMTECTALFFSPAIMDSDEKKNWV